MGRASFEGSESPLPLDGLGSSNYQYETLPDFEPLRLLKNNTPLDDFYGLSPAEMHHLLYSACSDKSPLRFRNGIDDSTLDNVPFFRLTEEFLKISQLEKSLKLTPLGALPKKVLHELYSHKLITEEIIEAGVSKTVQRTRLDRDNISLPQFTYIWGSSSRQTAD